MRSHIRHLPFLLLLSAAVSAPSRHARSQPAQQDEASELRRQAKAHFDQGVAAYRAGRYQDAVRAFLAADDLLPSPVLSFDAARAYENLGDAPRALAFYQDYLRREPSPPNVEAVRGRISALTTTLLARGQPLLTVLSEPRGAAVSVDGRALGSTPWAGHAAIGAHRVILTKQGYQSESRDVALTADHALELTLALVPGNRPSSAPPRDPTPRASTAKPPEPAVALRASTDERRANFAPWSFVVLGAGGASLLLAAGFEASRNSAEEDARDARTQIDYADRYDAMQGRQTAARVFAVAGSALLVAGGVLVVLDATRKSDTAPVAGLGCDGRSCLGSFAARF